MGVLLKGGTIVSAEKSWQADVRIEEEKIVEIGTNLAPKEEQVIDVTGKLLFPGFIDTHTHFDLDNGVFMTADNFETGTMAAVAGGTTTVLDFATQNKGETLEEALENWHKKADEVSSCDYGFHMAITDWNENVKKELPLMTKEGVTSYKLYMAYDALRVNDGEIFDVLKAVKEENGIVGMHCENGDLVNKLIAQEKAAGHLGTDAHPKSRPEEVEAEAVYRYMAIAKMADAPINVVHLSTKRGLELIKDARKEGQKVYIETCPQYLLMDDSKYSLPNFEGAKYTMSPPLRKPADNEALWQALKEDVADTVGTDHCSFQFAGQKDYGKDDFSKIPNGAPGVEHRPAVMYNFGVKEGKISKEQMCRLLAENPARLFGMYPQKGAIKEGSDADIVVWNPEAEWTIEAKTQVQNVDYTTYEGMKITGRPEKVFLRGNLVAENGSVVEKHKGAYVRRNACEYF